mmetsp:Transcript_4791/g.19526  ORF Transcript_4791/g.19526 Transcript_4791/m.19526 type:complete len:271 (+) Transcript_4791:142-954(+)
MSHKCITSQARGCRRGAQGRRCGGHPGGRAAQAGHDARRFVQHERDDRHDARRGVRAELPRGVLPRHLEPRQLDGAYLRRDAQEGRRLRLEEALRRDDARRRARADLRRREPGLRRVEDRRRRRRRARGDDDPAAALEGRGGIVLGRRPQGADAPHSVRRRRGRQGQGRRGLGDALDGLRGGRVHRQAPRRPRGRDGRHRVHVRRKRRHRRALLLVPRHARQERRRDDPRDPGGHLRLRARGARRDAPGPHRAGREGHRLRQVQVSQTRI